MNDLALIKLDAATHALAECKTAMEAKQIADIYKDRWQVELFFKWIKQNLKIKTFIGTSRSLTADAIACILSPELTLPSSEEISKLTKDILSGKL